MWSLNLYQCDYLGCYVFFPWQQRKTKHSYHRTLLKPGGTRVDGMFCKWKQATINAATLLTQVGTPVIDLHREFVVLKIGHETHNTPHLINRLHNWKAMVNSNCLT